MSCYFRHMKEVLEEAGITVNPSNKKQIDQVFHQIADVKYKDCPTTWRSLKQSFLVDEHKRGGLIKKLKATIH